MIECAWTFQELEESLFFRTLSLHERKFVGISTDSREPQIGSIFWCLAGEVHDSHSFAAQAVKNGASALVVHKVTPEIEVLSSRVTILLVPDTLLGLQELANSYRKRLVAPVVGITGSNGKTSTKEFAAHLLAPLMKVHWSKGSFNNHWGVPFTLLACPMDAEVVLVEMGMNHEGEIKRLCEIAEPDIVLCTLVGKTHIEHFGTVDRIAAAKEEIYKYCPSHALRIFNEDNAWTKAMLSRYEEESRLSGGDLSSHGGATASWSGVRGDAEVHLKVVGETFDGLRLVGQIGGLAGEAVAPVLGAHHVNNLMAAAAIGLAVGVRPGDIWKGLSRCQSAWGRMQLLKGRNGSHILFDGYNASPDSMAALISSAPMLAQLAGASRVFGVFAEMKELGSSAAAEHETIGALLGAVNFSSLWFYGPSCDSARVGWSSASALREAAGAGSGGGSGGLGGPSASAQTYFRFSEDFDADFAADFAALIGPGDLLVVKGSRGMKTERFVRLLADLPSY